MARKLIELIQELECQPNLPDNPFAWLDEDYPYHNLTSFLLNEAILLRADKIIPDPLWGVNYQVLETMRVAGCNWTELTMRRLAFLTRKGRILIIGPF